MTHFKQPLSVCAARVLRHTHADESAHSAGIFIFRRALHCFSLCADKMRRCHIWVAERGIALKLLDHPLILLGGSHRTDAERDDGNSAKLAPLLGENIVERIRHLHCVPGQSAVTNAHLRNSGKGGLECS